jgi:hypothetical protein
MRAQTVIRLAASGRKAEIEKRFAHVPVRAVATLMMEAGIPARLAAELRRTAEQLLRDAIEELACRDVRDVGRFLHEVVQYRLFRNVIERFLVRPEFRS